MHAYFPRSELLKEDYTAALVHLLALLESGDDEVARGEPGVRVVSEPVDELIAHQSGRL